MRYTTCERRECLLFYAPEKERQRCLAGIDNPPAICPRYEPPSWLRAGHVKRSESDAERKKY